LQGRLAARHTQRPLTALLLPLRVCVLQAASGEAAAKSAWAAAKLDMPSLMPSFAQDAKDVQKVVAQHGAAYLM
jgi:hypothetical protein